MSSIETYTALRIDPVKLPNYCSFYYVIFFACRFRRNYKIVSGQYIDAPRGDYYVTCSFDPNHVVLYSRMPYHIVKCIKNHPNHGKLQCPFDATEYIDSDKYSEHILICQSKRSVEDRKYDRETHMKAGDLCDLKSIPVFSSKLTEQQPSDEWDENNEEMYDFNEDWSGDVVGVGRGNRGREKLRNLGRGEMLKKIEEKFNNRRSSLGSNKSTSSSGECDTRSDVCKGQFEDL